MGEIQGRRLAGLLKAGRFSGASCVSGLRPLLPSLDARPSCLTRGMSAKSPRLCRLFPSGQGRSLPAVSPTIGRAEAHPSSIAILVLCVGTILTRGDPRLHLSALCFMQECETHPYRAVADAKNLPAYALPAPLQSTSALAACGRSLVDGRC